MTVKFDEYLEGGVCDVLLSPTATDYLAVWGKDANRRKHGKSLLRVLKKVREWGINGVNNTEQLRNEGKYPLGIAGKGSVTVYAVKAYQLRLYGGVWSENGRSAFVIVDGAIKKKDRTEKSFFEAIAKKVGEEYVKGR